MTNEQKQMMANVAIRVKEVRIQRGMSQHELATATGLSDYEVGGDLISLATLITLSRGLQCSLDYLLGLDVDYSPTTMKGRMSTAMDKLNVSEQAFYVLFVETVTKDR
jgi:transcriptional regulator with XRE-family HTH domain